MADISFLVFQDDQGYYRLEGSDPNNQTRIDMTEQEVNAQLAAQHQEEWDEEEEMKAQRLLAFLQTFDYNTEVEYFPNNGESYTTTTGEWLDRNDGDDQLAEFVMRQGNDILFATPEGEPLSPTDPVFTILDPRLT